MELDPINYDHDPRMRWLTPQLQIQFEKLRSATQESDRKLIMLKIGRIKNGD